MDTILVSRTESTSSSRGSKSQSVSARAKTSFRFARPPPSAKYNHFKARSKVLLQIQHLSTVSRPTPILEVLPFTAFAPKFIGRLPRIFQTRIGFGVRDLVIITSQTFDQTDGEPDVGERDDLSDREIVAVICRPKRDDGDVSDRTEIYFNRGPSWQAIQLENGAYELTLLDNQLVESIVRWVPKRLSGQTRQYVAQESSLDDKIFNFSILRSDSRRHPIIASMSRNVVEIKDQFLDCVNDSSPGSKTPTLINTDQHLRSLILVTGIWVTFCEGWTKDYSNPKISSSEVCQSPKGSYTDKTESSKSPRRGSSPKSPNQDPATTETSRQMSTKILHRSTASTPCAPFSTPLNPPKRAISTSGAFLDRANNRRFPDFRTPRSLRTVTVIDSQTGVSTRSSRRESAAADSLSPTQERSNPKMFSNRNGTGQDILDEEKGDPLIPSNRLLNVGDTLETEEDKLRGTRNMKRIMGFVRKTCGCF